MCAHYKLEHILINVFFRLMCVRHMFFVRFMSCFGAISHCNSSVCFFLLAELKRTPETIHAIFHCNINVDGCINDGATFTVTLCIVFSLTNTQPAECSLNHFQPQHIDGWTWHAIMWWCIAIWLWRVRAH